MADNVEKTALLVVDVQNAVTNKEDVFKFGYNRCGNCIVNINRLIAYGEKMGWEVVFSALSIPWYRLLALSLNKFAFLKGSDNVKLDERLQAVTKNVFVKTSANSLSNGKLRKYLKEKGIEKVMVCGLPTESRVVATARGAHARGFKVTVVSDACLSRYVDKAEAALTRLPAEEIEVETVSNIVLR